MADIFDAAASAAVPLDGGTRAGLGLAGAMLLGSLCTLVSLPLLLAIGRTIATLAGDPPRWSGFWLGLGLGLPTQYLATLALGGELDARHAAAALVAPIAAGAVAVATPEGRGRVFAVMLGLAPFIVLVEHGRRAVPTGSFPEEGSPDVLLVSVEGLRGGAWPTPVPRLETIDALAARGVRFERAITPVPAVGPAIDAILAARQSWETQPGGPRLAPSLRAAGWNTAAFSGRRDALASHTAGFERAIAGAPIRSAISGSLLRRVLDATGLAPPARRPDRLVVDDALAWLAAARSDPHRPAFAWVHLAGPSAPAVPTPPWDTAYATGDPWDPGMPPLVEAFALPADVAASVGDRTDPEWLLGQHAGAISAADAEIDRLLRSSPGGRSRPLVVAVVGTHGIALGDGGIWFEAESPPTPATAQVALILHAPGRLPAGTRSDEAVSIADLPATLLELAGAAPDAEGSDASLVPTAFGRRGRGWVATRGRLGDSATLFGRWWHWSTADGSLHPRAGAGLVGEDDPGLAAPASAVAAGRDPGPADPALRDLAAP